MTLAVCLPPLPGELLSSWVMRNCHANASSLYSLLWHHGLNNYAQVDIDQCTNRKLLELFAKDFNHPDGLPGVENQGLIPIIKMSRLFPHRSWIKGIDRRATTRRAFQYCPLCLRADDIPYFRMHWRLEWHEICPKHMVAMPNLCRNCTKPVILHRVKWESLHLANCYNCGFDLSTTHLTHVDLSSSQLSAILILYSVIESRNERKYEKIHFLEAMLEQWRRYSGLEKLLSALNDVGIEVGMAYAKAFPAMFLATTAIEVYSKGDDWVSTFINHNQRWFNLVVRDFQCPASMKKHFRQIKWAYELNDTVIQSAIASVQNSGNEPTPARIARSIGCHVSRIEKYMKKP